MQYPRLAIVDLETTGADPTRDRITEVAILVTEGDALIESWSSLVNPGVPIPERIQSLIGITDEMVRDAPGFAELASEITRHLDGAIFVAHNVRFDYNFLRAAFEREGARFHAPTLCSVRFSRALHPQFPRHGLDAIIERHGYTISSRHRALDDAQIVWQFLQDSRRDHAAEAITRAWTKALSDTPQPRLPEGDLEALPECPGVFVLRNAQGHPLEIGRARNLRSEVLGRFTRKGDARTARRAAEVKSVDSWPAAGELEASLMELRIERQEPVRAKRQEGAWGWRLDHTQTPVLQLVELSGSDPLAWHDTFACMRGELEAHKLLRELVAKHQLCPRRLGLEHGKGACHAHALGRCRGVCADKESSAAHDLRLMTALAGLRLRAWPYPGAVVFAEHDATHERSAFHAFDQWCHLGSRDSLEEARDLTHKPQRTFDAEIFRILHRWLSQPGTGNVC